jgi:3-phenylpropionate/trans-cinnamate dioxygenase ferredoxin reductase component
VSTVPTYVIVGANLAGGTAAAELREQGFDGRVVLIGEESIPPYERPPLSKEYLRGEQEFREALIRPEGWLEEHGVETRYGVRAQRIDAAARTVTIEGGEDVAFDKLLVATGCRNRRFPIPGLDLPGVLDLRTARDAEAVREAASKGGRAVTVGMGFIGAEVTASLRSRGLEVTAIEPQETPLHRVLGSEVGEVMREIHADHGIDMHFGDVVERFEGVDRVEAVMTRAGKRYECDFAVVGVGVQPNVEIAEDSGLEVEGGIVVDAGLETNVPGVFAAGDVAKHDHPVFGQIRVEHYDNAWKMGQHAARSMLGDKRPFDDAHWFWSDQYDANIQMAGFALSWDRIVFRGSKEDRSFSAFYLKDGVLRSVFSLNRPRDVRRSMPLIKAQLRPDPEELRNEDLDLRALLPKR